MMESKMGSPSIVAPVEKTIETGFLLLVVFLKSQPKNYCLCFGGILTERVEVPCPVALVSLRLWL